MFSIPAFTSPWLAVLKLSSPAPKESYLTTASWAPLREVTWNSEDNYTTSRQHGQALRKRLGIIPIASKLLVYYCGRLWCSPFKNFLLKSFLLVISMHKICGWLWLFSLKAWIYKTEIRQPRPIKIVRAKYRQFPILWGANEFLRPFLSETNEAGCLACRFYEQPQLLLPSFTAAQQAME